MGSATTMNGSPVGIPASSTRSLANPLLISMGFLGIQFAWSLQMGQMSPLLEQLGSAVWLTSLIWAAGPVTGVLVQPIVGSLSDNHRSALGRRRPFLIVGTLLVALSLVMMPNSGEIGSWLSNVLGVSSSFPMGLLIAAVLLWVLDASINLTQGPYRALVPDVFSAKEQTKAYAMMSLTIGLGSVASFLISFLMDDMKLLFYLGAAAIVIAMSVTVFTTQEPSTLEMPTNDHDINTDTKPSLLNQFLGGVKLTGNQWVLCLAHSFTWFGLMCLYIFFALFVPKVTFGSPVAGSPLYIQGVQWASLGLAVLNVVCFLFSPFIDKLCDRYTRKVVHSTTLSCMAVGLIGLYFINSPNMILFWMALIGLGWATTLSVPFAMLASHLPKGKEGVLMGVFNIFVAAPGLLCSLAVGPIIAASGMGEGLAFLLGGGAIIVSILLLQQFNDSDENDSAIAPATA